VLVLLGKRKPWPVSTTTPPEEGGRVKLSVSIQESLA
jgi:hypothetical protein